MCEVLLEDVGWHLGTDVLVVEEYLLTEKEMALGLGELAGDIAVIGLFGDVLEGDG